MLERHGKTDPDGKFDWGDALSDAGIMAGLTFFTTLGGIGAMGLLADVKQGLLACGIAAGSEFFAILVMKRGLKEKA